MMINWLHIKKASDDLWSPVTPEEAEVIKRNKDSENAFFQYQATKDPNDYHFLPRIPADLASPRALNKRLDLTFKDGHLYLNGNKIVPQKDSSSMYTDFKYENGKNIYRRLVKDINGEHESLTESPMNASAIETLDPEGNVIDRMTDKDSLNTKKIYKILDKASASLQKKFKKGLTREAFNKQIDPNGLLTYNNRPFNTDIINGISYNDLGYLRAGRKVAADYNTWYNSNSPSITPNLDEVAYLINHPDFMKQHMDNVRSDLKAFRLRDSQKGPFASRYTKPLTTRQTVKQQALADNYDSKFLNKDEKEINRYSKRLQKAISKFKDKYGAGNRHPYQGEGLPISRRHQDTSFYVIPV